MNEDVVLFDGEGKAAALKIDAVTEALNCHLDPATRAALCGVPRSRVRRQGCLHR